MECHQASGNALKLQGIPYTVKQNAGEISMLAEAQAVESTIRHQWQ